MKRTVVVMMVLIVSVLAGCAGTSRPPQEPQRTSALLPANKDRVWELVVSAVAPNFPVQAIEKESGLLSTEFVSVPVGFNNANMAEFVYPPRVFLGTWRGLRMSMRVLVNEVSSEMTSVAITAHYEAFENNVSKSWMVAESNGALENKILTKIESQL